MKQISVLGSTGSIGTQSLEVIHNLGFRVVGLTANRNARLLEEQARAFEPAFVACFDEKAAKDLKIRLADTSVQVLSGEKGICEIASLSENDLVLNAIVGIAGLQPTCAVLKAQKTLALANKETLVTGGSAVMSLAQKMKASILPVDSEHSAIFQCLQGISKPEFLHKIWLTASGGPFFGKKKRELEKVTPTQALKHPNWQMGAKITIDSATLMNKGLEVIEAAWLFQKPVEDIEVLVHRESVIHSAIELVDHSVLAQMGVADMKIPIQYAFTYPDRVSCAVQPLSLLSFGMLSFYPPDEDTFEALAACKRAFQKGGLAPCAANAANEIAVEAFLQEKISFLKIGEIVSSVVEKEPNGQNYTIEEVWEKDRQVRSKVRNLCRLSERV